ncbi:unnamed protein product [Diplocarpon coronariae]
MAENVIEPFFKGSTGRSSRGLLRLIILSLIAATAVASRLFSVIRFESIIHEFDPWFNFRATKYLVQHGFYDFWDWFDDRTWHPLGRVTGGTLYPGLMVTSGAIYHALRALTMPVDIRNICVLLAPGFSGLTAFATYLFTNEMSISPSAGLLAAIFMGIAPGYISRSVAGSYDNEAIAIFLLVFTFYLWIKALKIGSAYWGALCALFYGYMVSAWGGYVFITNLIPLHVFVLVCMGRFSPRLYVSYCSWYALGTLASMQIPFVGFLPIRSSEHMSALGVFGLLQLVGFVEFVRAGVPSKQFATLLKGFVLAVFVIAFGGLVLLTVSGVIAPWTGRFYSLWDTGYAKIHIPIIASVSEHQPTAWPAYFFDLNFLIWLFPAGVYLCFQNLADEQVFVVVYSILASYFSGVMVRLMLTLTPIVCVSAALALSNLFDTYLTIRSPKEPVKGAPDAATNGKATTKKADGLRSLRNPLVGVYTTFSKSTVVGALTSYLLIFVMHCTWVTSNAYSSPSVVLASRMPDGSQHIIDDYREAYQWLRQNTAEDAKIMSWWDYGYQIGGMADRPTLVDNNTWNNTHIATVGKAMSCREEVSYQIMRQHEVDYVLVVFGGLLGYSGDDINKFLWMVRIAEGIWPEEVKERDFFTPRGEYRVDGEATETMKNSLMYKLSYYNYNSLFPPGQAQDRVRNVKLPDVGPVLNTVEEAFTSENWIIRIYKVKDLDNVGRDHASAASFERGNKKKKMPKKRGPKVLRVDFKLNRTASESEDSSSSDEECVLAPGTPYLTKVNGKLVWARKKTPKSSGVQDLVVKAFKTRNATIRKQSKSLERPACKQLTGSVPVVQSQRFLAHSTPISQQPFPAMVPPMGQYPPQFGPPPLPLVQYYIPQQTNQPPPLFVQPSPTEKDYELLKAADAHFNKFYKPQRTRITSASSEDSQERAQNKTQERPDDKVQGKAQENTNEKAMLKATIAVTKHVCGECGRLRSRRFHHDNPLKTGEMPTPAFCRKCQRDASSTCSASESSTMKESEKKDKKRTNMKRTKKKGGKSKKKQANISSDEDECSENSQPDPPKKPKSNKPKKPKTKRVPSADYTTIEEKFSENEREPRGRSRSRSPEGPEFYRRPLSPLAPVKVREIFQEAVGTRTPSVHYRHVEIIPSHDSLQVKENPYPRKKTIHSFEEDVYERAASPPSHYFGSERMRGKAPSSKAYSVEESESLRRRHPSIHHRSEARDTPTQGLPSRGHGFKMHDVAAGYRPSIHHGFEARGTSIRVVRSRDHSFEIHHPNSQDPYNSEHSFERGQQVRRSRSRNDSIRSRDLPPTGPVSEERGDSARGRPSRENSLEDLKTIISKRSAQARQRRRRERTPRPESPRLWEEPRNVSPRRQDEVRIVKETFEYRPERQVDDEAERRRQEYIDRATLSPRKGSQFSDEEAVQYYYEDWSRAEPDSILVPSIVTKSYQGYRPDSVTSHSFERKSAAVPLIAKNSYHGYRREIHTGSDLSEPEASHHSVHHNLPRVPTPPSPRSHSKVDEWQDQPPYPPSSGSEAARRRRNARDRKILHMPHVQIPGNHLRKSSKSRIAYIRDESDDPALVLSPKPSIERDHVRYDRYMDSNFTEILGPTRYSEVSVSNLTELERQAEAESRHVTFWNTPSDPSELQNQRYRFEDGGAAFSGGDGGWYDIKTSSVGGGTDGGRAGGWNESAAGGHGGGGSKW